MKFITWIGMMIMAVLAVVLGNVIYSVLSVKAAERMGILPKEPKED
jgi:putative Ca2+/H+ antiporter (TMEM165/GDT1 family)